MTDPDLHTIRRDDQLLDRIGRGERVTCEDDVEAMLAAWQQTLPVADRPDERLLAAITPKRSKRRAAASLGVAASVVLISGGVAVAAASAGPDSPLWPVTRLVYGPQAESRQALASANDAVSDARIAAGEGRYPEALRLLTTADALLDKIDEPAEEQRIREDITKIRHQLPAGTTTQAKTPAHTPDAPGSAKPNAPAQPNEPHQAHPPADGHNPDLPDDHDRAPGSNDEGPKGEPAGHEHSDHHGGGGPKGTHP